jgi:hypothetical protein
MCKVILGDAGLPSVGADERLRGRTAVQDYLGRLSPADEARRAGMPLMAYFYVRKRGKATRQMTACMMTARLFTGSDTGIGTASKFFVTCDVDVSSVGPRMNPVFNAQTAPAIVLLDSKGNLISLLTGRISASSLLRAMMQTLARSGVSTAKITVGKKILSQISKFENEKVSAELRYSSAQRGLAEAKRRRQRARIASQQGLVEKASRTLKSAAEALARHEKLWDDLFAKS